MLVLIIICAFANFFYILNQNTPANLIYAQEHPEEATPDETYTYINKFFDQPALDSLIAMYLLSLGDF